MKIFKKRGLYLLIILGIFLADKISKIIINSIFSQDNSHVISVIKGFFNIIYVENRGAIWGTFQEYTLPITIVSIIALFFLLFYFFKIPQECKLELIAFSFVCGGALGNISDRIIQGYVVDFVDMYVGKFHWATYNIADSFISIGIVLLLISIIFNKCPDHKKSNKKEV